MKSKKENFLEGRDYIKDINYEGLITMATNNYNIVKKSGKWGAKSLEEEKIMALSAELNNLKGELILSKNFEAATVGGGGGNKHANNANTSNGGDNSKKKNKKNKK